MQVEITIPSLELILKELEEILEALEDGSIVDPKAVDHG